MIDLLHQVTTEEVLLQSSLTEIFHALSTRTPSEHSHDLMSRQLLYELGNYLKNQGPKLKKTWHHQATVGEVHNMIFSLIAIMVKALLFCQVGVMYRGLGRKRDDPLVPPAPPTPTTK